MGLDKQYFKQHAIKLPLGANNICLVYKYNVSYTVYIFYMMVMKLVSDSQNLLAGCFSQGTYEGSN